MLLYILDGLRGFSSHLGWGFEGGELGMMRSKLVSSLKVREWGLNLSHLPVPLLWGRENIEVYWCRGGEASCYLHARRDSLTAAFLVVCFLLGVQFIVKIAESDIPNLKRILTAIPPEVRA